MGLPLVSTRSTLIGHIPLVAVAGLMVLLFAATAFRAPGAASAPAAAVAGVVVVDPIDGWLGSCADPTDAACPSGDAVEPNASIDGDLALARLAVGPDVAVSYIEGSLRFEASGDRADVAELRLTDALASYEQARSDLRRDLEERLALLPELAAFVETRSATIEDRVADIDVTLAGPSDGQMPSLRAERAAAIASALDFERRGRELLTLTETTLAPAWVSTPVGGRLDRLDALLGDAFWFAAGENVESPDRSR